jgi:tetratricopeptide (TPR) repeat protein
MEILRSVLDRAARGSGQMVAVVGEPGVGKSRLFWELTRSPLTRGWLTLEASSVSWGKTTAYLPVVQLLRAYFQIQGSDDPRRVREKVTGKVLTLDQALASTIPALLTLLDVAVEDSGWREIDPPERRQKTLDAVRRVLLHESQVQPLVLMFEDLHWADGESLAVLDSLVEGLPAARMMLLVNYRAEYESHWAAKSYCTQLRVGPLPAESASVLLESVLGGDASLSPLKQLLIERTEGNPFFLEECVRTLVETEVLVGARGAYEIVGPIDAIRIPATVQTILAARIDRLSVEEKSLLQLAAVVGDRVPHGLLDAVAEVPNERLRPALTRLQGAEFLYEASFFPEVEYSFTHALTQDVVYASLLHERRRGLHARILNALEQLSAERQTDDVDRLAHHARRGEVWDKAVAHFRRAGAKAMMRSAYSEAVSCFEQSLDALRCLPVTRETAAMAIDLRLDLRTALTPLGRYQKILELLREAEALASELHDDRRLGQVVADMSARLRNIGDHAGALEAGRRACAIGAALGDRDLQFEASYRLAQAHFAVGDVMSSVNLLHQAVKILGDAPSSSLPRYLAAWPRAWLAIGLARLGRFAEAIALGEAAVRIAESTAHPHSLIEAQSALARVHLDRGDHQHAIALFEQGLGPSLARNIWDSSVFSSLGYAYVLTGKGAEGLPLLQEAVKRGQSIDALGISHAMRLSRLAEGYLLSSRLDEARESAQQALAVARAQQERGNEAYALHLLGEIAAHAADPSLEQAERDLKDALARSMELQMRPLTAHCRLSLGRLYRRSNRPREAREQVAAAMTSYAEMGMDFWREKAQVEAGKLE